MTYPLFYGLPKDLRRKPGMYFSGPRPLRVPFYPVERTSVSESVAGLKEGIYHFGPRIMTSSSSGRAVSPPTWLKRRSAVRWCCAPSSFSSGRPIIARGEMEIQPACISLHIPGCRAYRTELVPRRRGPLASAYVRSGLFTMTRSTRSWDLTARTKQ